jgi:GTP-binding protein
MLNPEATAARNLFRRAEFVKSADAPRDLPLESIAEVAFAGRSNAGKSSVLNTLVERKGLAIVSKTPGRTRHINYFGLGDGRFMVDLPGYGYAQVPGVMRDHWQGLLSSYLISRSALRGLVIVMDARHPLTPLDARMLTWFSVRERPTHLLLTKSDKLTRQQATNQLRIVDARLQTEFRFSSAQLFSSVTSQGVDQARSVVYQWLRRDENEHLGIDDAQKEAPAEGESDRG